MSEHLPPTVSPPGPGRPKDPAKRAAILEAARRMFSQHGFEGASMDQIAAEAGVSKLTVYSHFGEKSALFATIVRMYCEQSLPAALFEPAPEVPLRERLLEIARAFFSMITTPEALAGHRALCTPRVHGSQLPEIYWEAGPQRVQSALGELLQRRIAFGELQIDDVPRAASQFFVLVKGDLQARMLFGHCDPSATEGIEEHLQASVDMFLLAYGRPRPPARA